MAMATTHYTVTRVYTVEAKDAETARVTLDFAHSTETTVPQVELEWESVRLEHDGLVQRFSWMDEIRYQLMGARQPNQQPARENRPA
jgi:hypothetical protein